MNILKSFLKKKTFSKKEKELADDFRSEMFMNQQLHKLHTICRKKNLIIPKLTNLDGNCLFESLIYHGIAEKIGDLRLFLAKLMLLYKNDKNFLPNITESMAEMFEHINEILYVKYETDNANHYCHYTYDVMCHDLANMYSWKRLPTELILMVISFVFNLKIVILNSLSEYENVIFITNDTSEENNPKIIYLGIINDLHYVPIGQKDSSGNLDYKEIYYDEAKKALENYIFTNFKILSDFQINEKEKETKSKEKIAPGSPSENDWKEVKRKKYRKIGIYNKKKVNYN